MPKRKKGKKKKPARSAAAKSMLKKGAAGRPSEDEIARVVAENRETMRRAGVTEDTPRTDDVVRRLNKALREIRAENQKGLEEPGESTPSLPTSSEWIDYYEERRRTLTPEDLIGTSGKRRATTKAMTDKHPTERFPKN
jgi:hypothetical protein